LTVNEKSEEVEARYVEGKFVRKENYISSKRGHGHTWTTTNALPSGRLRLQAYSPYARADWTSREEETKKSNAPTEGVVKALEPQEGGARLDKTLSEPTNVSNRKKLVSAKCHIDAREPRAMGTNKSSQLS